MDIYLGGVPGDKGAMYVTTYSVGLGKDDSTPTGTWICEPGRKLTNPTYYSPRGEGVIQAGDPKNPLGKFWIGLAGTDGQAVGKTSYGIHGNIDADSIGKQASMGCIRMKNEDIAVVYEMLIEGKSDVIVKDDAFRVTRASRPCVNRGMDWFTKTKTWSLSDHAANMPA